MRMCAELHGHAGGASPTSLTSWEARGGDGNSPPPGRLNSEPLAGQRVKSNSL